MRFVELDFEFDFLGDLQNLKLRFPLDASHVFGDKVLDGWFTDFVRWDLERVADIDLSDETTQEEAVEEFESHDALHGSLMDALVFKDARTILENGREFLCVEVSVTINGEVFSGTEKWSIEDSYYPVPAVNDLVKVGEFMMDEYHGSHHYFDVDLVDIRVFD